MLHRLALAGCGGMSRRHLRGYRVLEDHEPGRIEVAAVVDPELERADFLAGETEDLFGKRPLAFRSIEDAVDGVPDLSVVDIVAAASVHHRITETAVDAGLHVLCEKPMAPTVAACRFMEESARRGKRVLSIAENFRRDPISRLAHALLRAGAIGEIQAVVDNSSGGSGRTGNANPWRYLRKEGGPILESGVHNADMQMYLGGSVDRVTGQVRLQEKERVFKGARVKAYHDHYAEHYPDVQPADAPDIVMATFEYTTGALGQWLYDQSAHGPGFSRFTFYGSGGQLDLPGVRNGRPLRLFRDDHVDVLSDEEVLALVPDFSLDSRAARYFGGERLACYDAGGTSTGGNADLNILAMEVAEFLDAVDGGPPVEVGPEAGLVAVTLVMACHESAEAGRWVSMAEVIDGSLRVYQDVANRELGLC